MAIKLLACKVFQHELEYLTRSLGGDWEVEYFELGEHARPTSLRAKLQARIDAIAEGPERYAAVVLAYGLCGRATDGLQARRETLVIPRAHDCATLLLGSRKTFETYFREMPSTPFSSVGYMTEGNYYFESGELEKGDSYAALVSQYGEEDAQYIWEAMHPRLEGELQPILYIENPEVADSGLLEKCRAKAAEEGREFRLLAGNLRLLRQLLTGPYPEEEFLTVRPGQTVRQVGDWDEIIRADQNSSS